MTQRGQGRDTGGQTAKAKRRWQACPNQVETQCPRPPCCVHQPPAQAGRRRCSPFGKQGRRLAEVDLASYVCCLGAAAAVMHAHRFPLPTPGLRINKARKHLCSKVIGGHRRRRIGLSQLAALGVQLWGAAARTPTVSPGRGLRTDLPIQASGNGFAVRCRQLPGQQQTQHGWAVA